jgi:signal transduction histidine kinase
MSEHAAALSPPLGAEPFTAEREAFLDAAGLASLGALVRGLSHEISNPLFGMLGLVELLQTESEPGTKQHERLRLIHQSGLELRRITRALQMFARVDATAGQVVPLEELAAQAVELVTCATVGNGFEIRELYPAEPLLVRGSPARLAQVFLTLLVNGSGVVEVRLARLGLDAAAEIARMHGGELSTQPTIGGATHVVRLPLARS